VSTESQFIARAGRLAGGWGATSAAPSARYVLPQFEERTAYGFKRQDPYTKEKTKKQDKTRIKRKKKIRNTKKPRK
jgi:hypothetical protein